MTPPFEPPAPAKSRLPLVIGIIAAALAAALVWYLAKTPPAPPPEPVLTPEAKAYTKYLQLSNVEMKAWENAVGQMLVEILGDITNGGDRPVRRALLTCIFYDPQGVEVHRERVAIVREKDGVLQPGQTRRFRLAFDTLPANWNQAMPRLVIAEIVFGDEDRHR